MVRPISVAAVDNHPIVLAGIGAALTQTAPDLTLEAVASSIDDLLSGPGAAADIVLLDLRMDRPDGREPEDDVKLLVDRGFVVLIYTSEERPVPVRKAIVAGASGLLLKVDPIESIAAAIRDAMDGQLACSGPLAHALLTDEEVVSHLSPRQVEILRNISEGLPYRSIARNLDISESTVREHLNRAVAAYRGRGFDLGNSHGLVRVARAEGHLDD